jgi:hypothetical protein
MAIIRKKLYYYVLLSVADSGFLSLHSYEFSLIS